MKSIKTKLTKLFFSEGSGNNLFYVLAFAPLLIISYYSIFSAIIPLYGFLLLLIKDNRLPEAREASLVQRILGITAIASSFFVYYAVILIYPNAAFYGPANYAVYIFGLFLLFFRFSALKEAFAPLFLIVAASSSEFISAWLEPFLSPYTNDLAHVIVSVLRALGTKAYLYYAGNIPVVALSSLSGKIVGAAFVYECIGVYSMLVFSIILIVVLFDDPNGMKTKIAYSIVGLLGTFALNILRITAIFLADYFFGAEVGATIHYVIGYVLFSIWLVCFFYIYSKRQTIHAKITSLWSKTAHRNIYTTNCLEETKNHQSGQTHSQFCFTEHFSGTQ